MKGKIYLGKGLSVEATALASQIVAALGMRGSGKSNSMAVIAEGLLHHRIQIELRFGARSGAWAGTWLVLACSLVAIFPIEAMVLVAALHESASSGFVNALSKLRVLELAHGRGQEPMRISDTFREATP
jgi:hypothetical protein